MNWYGYINFIIVLVMLLKIVPFFRHPVVIALNESEGLYSAQIHKPYILPLKQTFISKL